MRFRLVCGLCTAICALAPVSLHGQARSVITPSVSFGAGYDDNILGQPARVSDNVYRLTPALAIVRDTPRVSWVGNFSMDSEWFGHRDEFNTPVARQHADSRVRWQVRPVTFVTFVGGYDNSVNPSEINLTTGLTPGRTRAWRTFGETEGEFHVTPVITLLTRYRATGEFASLSTDLLSHLGEFEAIQAITPRDDLRARYTAELFLFEGADNDFLSHTGTFGWEHKLTESAKFSVDGGLRRAAGKLTPEALVEISRDTSVFDVTASYAWTRTSALGVSSLVDVQRGTVTLRYDYPRVVAASLTGGLFVNKMENRRADVYLLSADVVRQLFGPVGIAVSGSIDHQRGRIESVGVRLPTGTVTPPILLDDQNIRRATVAFRIVISGSMKSASGPGLPRTDPQQRNRHDR